MAALKAVGSTAHGQPAPVTAQQKLEWLQIVTLDARASNAVRIAIVLATKYLNRETGEAWPSLDTLAKDLGVNAKTVSRGVNTLVSLSYLAKQRGVGRRLSNRYRLCFPEGKGDKVVYERGTILSENEGQKCPTNPVIKPDERTHLARNGAVTSFEEFERAWRWEPADPRTAARQLFEALDEDERAEAVRRVSEYLADCIREGRRQCFAKTYLAERKWKGFNSRAICGAIQTPRVVVFKGTPQWDAWTRHNRRLPPTKQIGDNRGRFRDGWYFPSEWPPGFEPCSMDEGGGGR